MEKPKQLDQTADQGSLDIPGVRVVDTVQQFDGVTWRDIAELRERLAKIENQISSLSEGRSNFRSIGIALFLCFISAVLASVGTIITNEITKEPEKAILGHEQSLKSLGQKLGQ